ncbi:hypothetical protein T01_662, partial [Trichinella spiralis]
MFKSEMCERFSHCAVQVVLKIVGVMVVVEIPEKNNCLKVEKKLVQVLDLCRRGRLVLRRDETVAARVGVQGRQNDANELNAHWLSLGFCILFLSVFSILVLFLVCNILHILRFSLDTQSLDSSLHRSRQFAHLDSPPSHFTFVESSIGSLCEEK